MIPSAKVLGRPIVNGSLGIAPPWFTYASNVLHRFPDPESLWLLRKWKVDTVVSLVGNVQGELPTSVEKVFENGTGVIYELAARPEDMPHPSGGTCVVSDGRVRIEGASSQPERIDNGAAVTVAVPQGLSVKALEVSFRQSLVEQMPGSIGVYAFQGTNRVRLNQDHSGEWIESLTADALLRRKSPVAMVRLTGPQSRELQVEFRKSDRQPNTDQSAYADWWFLSLPPIQRIALCGQWTR